MADNLKEIGQVNIPRDTTIKEILDAEQERNLYLAVMAQNSMADVMGDYAAIQRIVRLGYASQVFEIGDQINAKYTYNGTTYDWPFDVVSFEDVELTTGEVVPGMILQAHYCTPFNLMFDSQEALYYAADGLAAGTYNFMIAEHPWYTDDTGKTFQFTLSSAVPAGGLLKAGNAYNASFEGATLSVYQTGSDTTAQQTATITEGSSGTSLGTITSDTVTETLNQNRRILAGYNRYAQSGMRQWLNSAAAAGQWWESQNNFDIAPSQLAANPGFMTGFEEEFLNILKPTKVVTSRNTQIDDGGEDVTYDTFWPISLEQAYISPQISGVEGDAFEYWKRALGTTSPVGRNDVEGTWAVTYAINAQTTAQIVRFRSAYRTNSVGVWSARATGALNTHGAGSAYRVAPACVIC